MGRGEREGRGRKGTSRRSRGRKRTSRSGDERARRKAERDLDQELTLDPIRLGQSLCKCKTLFAHLRGLATVHEDAAENIGEALVHLS